MLPDLTGLDVVDLAVGGLGGLLYVVTGVVFVVWLWKVYSSNRVDPVRLRHGRGWTIGAWFVPILNLFRPFQLVRDLRDGIRSSMGATGPDPAASGSLTGFDLIESVRTRWPARRYHAPRRPDASRGEPARHRPGGCFTW